MGIVDGVRSLRRSRRRGTELLSRAVYSLYGSSLSSSAVSSGAFLTLADESGRTSPVWHEKRLKREARENRGVRFEEPERAPPYDVSRGLGAKRSTSRIGPAPQTVHRVRSRPVSRAIPSGVDSSLFTADGVASQPSSARHRANFSSRPRFASKP